jgi:hypothetical protein
MTKKEKSENSASLDRANRNLYCLNCGSPMTKHTSYLGTFYACSGPCSVGRHFRIAYLPHDISFCSCDGGGSELQETDYGIHKVYQCPICRMKLVLTKGDHRIESEIDGITPADVSRVACDALQMAGVSDVRPLGPDDVRADLACLKHTLESDMRNELLRIYERCKSDEAKCLKGERQEIRRVVKELGIKIKALAHRGGRDFISFSNPEFDALMSERHKLSVRMRSLYRQEYHNLEREMVDIIANQLALIRRQYRIGKNPEFGNLSPDLLDPVIGLNAEVKVIDQRDDYWVAKGIKQALSYCEIGRFGRAQFILLNFASCRYVLADGLLNRMVDVLFINIADPPSAGVKPVLLERSSLVNLLDVGGVRWSAGGVDLTDDTLSDFGSGSDLQLSFDDLDKEIH